MPPTQHITRPRTFFDLLREVRDIIYGLILIPREAVNLSQLLPLPQRCFWTYHDQRHCDPPLLYVNQQISAEATMVHYNRRFIIDINCGSQAHAASFDQKQRGFQLNGRFQFHLAKQITLRIGIYAENELRILDHVFDHMIYICGLLFSEANSIKDLGIEFSTGLENWEYVNPHCVCFTHAAGSGAAQHFNLNLFPSAERLKARIKFFLQPLALLGRVDEFEVYLPGRLRWASELEQLVKYYGESMMAVKDKTPISEHLLWRWDHYGESATGVKDMTIGYDESLWLWDRYLDITDAETLRRRTHNTLGETTKWRGARDAVGGTGGFNVDMQDEILCRVQKRDEREAKRF
ncbi:MAG: hypothetical protein Q9179_001327 [Wetmoreana sp. 5 TL-2023]